MDEDVIEEVEEKPSIFRRIFIIIILIFLLFLFLSYFFGNGIIIDFIISRTVSYTPENFIVKAKNITVVFDKIILDRINELYKENSGRELKICLKGWINESYNINDFYIPKQRRFFNEVISEYCEDSIIDLHTHPNDHCIFSNVDILTYKKMKLSNENLAIGLTCNVNRFNFYRN